jgi:anti-sigma B factor antagonist
MPYLPFVLRGGSDLVMNYAVTLEPGVTLLRLSGELDVQSCPELRPLLDTLATQQGRNVTVDLSELQLIDSSGVGVLVSLYKRVRSRGGTVKFVGVTAQPLAIFKLLRLDRAFECSPALAPSTLTHVNGSAASPQRTDEAI